MITPPEMRDLAERLIAYEWDAYRSSGTAESAALRVYEKLRQSLAAIAGSPAFESFALRALAQARAEAPGLGAVQVAVDGTLQGFGEFEHQMDMDLAGEEATILIARLLNLLHVFLGEAVTLSLLRDAWPGTAFDDRSWGNGRKS